MVKPIAATGIGERTVKRLKREEGVNQKIVTPGKKTK